MPQCKHNGSDDDKYYQVKVQGRKYTGQIGKFIRETKHGWIMLEFKDGKTKYKPENSSG